MEMWIKYKIRSKCGKLGICERRYIPVYSEEDCDRKVGEIYDMVEERGDTFIEIMEIGEECDERLTLGALLLKLAEGGSGK